MKLPVYPGEFRVRIGMLHPKSIIGNVEKLVEAFNHENVYKFLHIPIQSGNDSVLNDMNRGHTVAQFKEIISKFKRRNT